MKKYQIATLDTRSLDNTSLAQILTSTASTLSAFVKESKSETFYSQNLPVLEKTLARFEVSIHQSRTGSVTKKLDAADRERDRALTTITKLVRAYSSVPTEPIASSYQLLAELLKSYKINSKTSYEKESELLRNLIKDLAQDKYGTAITALHLLEPINSLRTAQAQFDKVYKERLAEQTTQIPSQAKELRKELLDLYNLTIDYTAINATAHPEKPHLAKLRDELNTIRKRYKTNTPKKEADKAPQTES